jgi:hypothetical protein
MKIKEWVVQTGNGSYIALDLRNKLIFTKKVQKALLLDTKKEAMRYINKYTPWKPKRLTFELVDKPTGKPTLYKWVIQVTNGGLTQGINGWYANYDKYDNVTFVKDVRRACHYDSREDALCFSDSYIKWKVKKLVFELVG